MRALILNADDFGLTPGVTDGILKAHSEGLLTSTSLLIGAPDAPRAARLARGYPRLGVGLHLALTAVRPILPTRRVRTLVGPDGRFPMSLPPVAARLALRRVDLREVEQELEAQIMAAQDAGLRLTHIDGHNHLHVHPRILPIVLELMRRHDIPAIRLPRPAPTPELRARALVDDPVRTLKGYVLRAATFDADQLIRRAGIRTTDHFFGFEYSGRFVTRRLLETLSQLPEGTTEIMLHPGLSDPELTRQYPWGYDWEEELEALLAPEVAARIRTERISLVHFGALGG